MNTELISATETQSASPVVTQSVVVESGLDQRFNDAYRLKLSGVPIQEIADSFGVDRSTIWRWCKAVEQEAQNQLANKPIFNIIAREVAKLDDLEQQARRGAETTKSDRAKSMFLAEARRAAVSRQNLLVTIGILPKAPDQIFRVTADLKPGDKIESPNERLPRTEAVGQLIEAMQKSRFIG